MRVALSFVSLESGELGLATTTGVQRSAIARQGLQASDRPRFSPNSAPLKLQTDL